MSKTRLKIPDSVKDALNDTGKSWEVVPGGKHFKVKIGSVLVGILPHSHRRTESGRGEKNLIAQIRRFA